MSRQYERDQSGALQGMYERVVQHYEEFQMLECLHVLWTWRLGDPETDHEKQWIAAKTKKLPVRERDIYGFDAEICVHRDTWMESTSKAKFQLIFHELLHLNVLLNEELQPEEDDDGRIKFLIAPHDLRILTFEREVEVFGVPSQFKGPMRKLQGAEETDGN